MRLLHFDALGRLVLTDFRSKTIPPYAILSHRWSDSEILMEDIASGGYKEREEGYRKLQFCAKQAAQDELQYFWIDTCCIDKWNLSELSKAINSMFQWYKNATRCYVFLSDVSVSTTTEPVQRSDWEASFRDSVWFTRGWTLQELIAPLSVEFFSCEGQPIGDKASLDQLIHEITGIPLAALRNCPLDQFTTSERERWAENRRTTEEEDIVYCLLGILGVHIQTAYGEGQESARSRLQAEVVSVANVPSIIPFSQNPRFVGRESQLAELEGKLFSNKQTTTTLAIVGPGGSGKSQLALEVAHKTRQNMDNCSVFWMDASDKDSLYQSYATVAQKLRIPRWDDDHASIKQLAERCVVEISARQCLLIFDNAEDTILRSGGWSTTEAADLADWLPQSKLCSAIFTTTNYDIAEALAPQGIIALQELTLDTALEMLQTRLATPLPNTQQQEAKHLLEELLYLPLAIAQAAACINASGITVQNYQAQLDAHNDAAIDQSNESSAERLQRSSIADPIAATLSLSLDQIVRKNALAAEYLFHAACVNWKDIPLDLLEAASPQVKEDAIKVLDRYTLVTRRPAESALDIHRLVHQALRKRLQAQGQFQQWTQRTITQLLQVFPSDDHNRSKWRRLLPHAQYTLSHSPMNDDDKKRLDLLCKCAMAVYSDGRYKEAEELCVQVMETRKRVLGDEHPDTLTSIANLASTYRSQGRWKEAEELQAKQLGIFSRVLGEEHPSTLTSMDDLASTYRSQGRWKEAEELQVKQLGICSRVLGEEHPSTLTSMANLALTYSDQGWWKEAEELFVQVIETEKRVLREEHPSTLTSMANLASTYRNQGRWKEAEELFVQVMETFKRVLREEHPSTLISMANLALTYSYQGRWKEAEELEVQVMETRKRVLGEEHPSTLTSIANLASTYRSQGRWKEAEELQAKQLGICSRVLREEHPSTLTSMANLALTYSDQGRWKEAEELFVQVIETEKRVLREEHPSTLTSMANLALTYRKQGRWKEAEELNVQVIETRKRVLGEEHPSTLTSIANLASTYRSQGRWKEAEELQAKQLGIFSRVLGEEHPSTLTSMDNLASTYRSQGRWKEAEELQVKQLGICSRVLGEEHPYTLTSMANLGSTYRNQGRWKEAEELQAKELGICSRVLGEEHPSTLTSMANLSFTLQSQTRHREALTLMERCFRLRQQVLGEQHPDTQSSLISLAGWRADWDCSDETS